MDPQTLIARRVALELRSGDLVNLGIGIPSLVANYVPPGLNVFFQSENGFDRHRASSRSWHGGADVNRCRWTPDRCAARRMHLRQRDVLWFDPWLERLHHPDATVASRC